jgi:hypothetical protein
VNFNTEQRAKIKHYIDQGGLLVAVNEGAGRAMADSIVALASELYPDYPFKDVPQNHLIYTANFPVKRPTAPIRMVANGVRSLIVLYPAEDMTWLWHSTGGGFLAANSPYASLANAWLYATDRENPRFKGVDTWIDPDPKVETTQTFSVARIRHDDNWNPEPAGWQRMAAILRNQDQIELIVPADSAPPKQSIAHLTTTGAVGMSAAQIDALRYYLNAGGLLLMDAAGGSPEAPVAFEAVLKALYSDMKLEPLTLDHPIFRGESYGGLQIDDVNYRRSKNIEPNRIPKLRGATANGRLVAIVSYEDLSGALVGYPTAGLVGYTPASAAEIVRNIILWRLSTAK